MIKESWITELKKLCHTVENKIKIDNKVSRILDWIDNVKPKTT